jgi:thiol-disulfide isomerase/thioredoxin|uniref:Thioredoxin domain-containing protein n=1 Tax=viral metagenome TaxID=1070528 RepID=A0A6C0BXQ2_9ZZZZ
MIARLKKMCNSVCRTVCRKLGLPKVICCAVLVVVALYLAKKYLLPLVEGMSPNSGKKKFVFCYMNGCPHCDKAMPAWDEFAKSCSEMECKKIESKEDAEFMKKHEVQGYPTYLLLDGTGEKVAEYSGDRSVKDLKKFATENA